MVIFTSCVTVNYHPRLFFARPPGFPRSDSGIPDLLYTNRVSCSLSRLGVHWGACQNHLCEHTWKHWGYRIAYYMPPLINIAKNKREPEEASLFLSSRTASVRATFPVESAVLTAAIPTGTASTGTDSMGPFGVGPLKPEPFGPEPFGPGAVPIGVV